MCVYSVHIVSCVILLGLTEVNLEGYNRLHRQYIEKIIYKQQSSENSKSMIKRANPQIKVPLLVTLMQ